MNGLFDIKGKVVVMTGACGVLGSTIVKYFASEGCKVVLLDLERAENMGYCLVSEIKAAGGDAMFLPTNVLDESALEKNLSEPEVIWARQTFSRSRPLPTWTLTR